MHHPLHRERRTNRQKNKVFLDFFPVHILFGRNLSYYTFRRQTHKHNAICWPAAAVVVAPAFSHSTIFPVNIIFSPLIVCQCVRVWVFSLLLFFVVGGSFRNLMEWIMMKLSAGIFSFVCFIFVF